MKITLLAADSQHPNRHPFEGLLTWFGTSSDNPVGGANGKRVYIPVDVGNEAIATIEGMGVNVDDSYGRHNKKKKIGVIETAWTGDPDENGAVPVYVRGYLFAADFPDEVADLQAEKDDLGFSYEAKAAGDNDGSLYRVTSLVFTGATILYKNKAAYTKTSLAAGKDDNVDKFLTKFLQAMGIDNPAVQNAENVDDAADDEVTRQAFAQLAEAMNAFREFKELLGSDGYASLTVCLSAAAEHATKVDELTQKVEGLETALTASSEKVEALTTELAEAKTSLTAAADVNLDGYVKSDSLEGYVKVEKYDELRAQADEMKAKVDEIVAEAGDKAAYERKSYQFPLTLSAHYNIDEKDTLEASIAEIGKREDLGPVEKLTAIMEAEARLAKNAK